MNPHKNMMKALAITIIIVIVVAGATENIRQYVQFSWQIEEGDSFVYEATVFGYYKQGLIYVPLTLRVLNNTRLLVTIITLPDVPLFINSEGFAEGVIEYSKTNTTYENKDLVPFSVYHETNMLASRCFLPKGTWSLLDSFYPDNIEQPENATIEFYVSIQLQDSFYIGYVSYGENRASGWFGQVSKDTGIPKNMTVWAWALAETHEYAYNMTLTLTV